jgi:hypothetical protein
VRADRIDVPRLTAILGDHATARDLDRYFALDMPRGSVPAFTGARFEQLGLNHPPYSDRITADDIVAVSTLGASVPVPLALDLLEGDLGGKVRRRLEQIPSDVRLGDDTARRHLVPGGAADGAWHLLLGQLGVSGVLAGRLLARKRPHLVPVHDNVVACALQRPRSAWLALHDALREDPALAQRLDALHRLVGLPAAVSRIRVLGVALWMRHHQQHRGSGCPGVM